MPSLTIYVTNADHARLLRESTDAQITVTRYAGKLLAEHLTHTAAQTEPYGVLIQWLRAAKATGLEAQTPEAISEGTALPLIMVRNLLKTAKDAGQVTSTFRAASGNNPAAYVWAII